MSDFSRIAPTSAAPSVEEGRDSLAIAHSTLPIAVDAERRIAALETAVTLIRGELDVLLAVIRHQDAILLRHGAGGAFPNAIRLMASEFVHGASGFYGLEFSSDGRAYRWTGPVAESRLLMWVDRSAPSKLTMSFVTFGSAELLLVTIDGRQYPSSTAGSGAPLVVGPIPPRSSDGPTEIRFSVDTMFSPSDHGGGDKRRLGVALSWLEFGPLET